MQVMNTTAPTEFKPPVFISNQEEYNQLPTTTRNALEQHRLIPAADWVTALLNRHQEALGVAYGTLHELMTLMLEETTRATGDQYPEASVHVLTAKWKLEIMLERSKKCIYNHLLDARAPWFGTIQKFLDVRTKFQEVSETRGEKGKPRPVGLVLRCWFKPFGRKDQTLERVSGEAMRYFTRNIIEESKLGYTEISYRKKRALGQDLPDILFNSFIGGERESKKQTVTLSPFSLLNTANNMSGKSRLGQHFSLVDNFLSLSNAELGDEIAATASEIVQRLNDTQNLRPGEENRVNLWMRRLWCGIRAHNAGTPFVLELLQTALERGLIAADEIRDGHAGTLKNAARYTLGILKKGGWQEIERDFGPGTSRAIRSKRNKKKPEPTPPPPKPAAAKTKPKIIPLFEEYPPLEDMPKLEFAAQAKTTRKTRKLEPHTVNYDARGFAVPYTEELNE
jgi:peptidoglycan hydrolase-like protein with peptidoglycan-binding domain